MRNRNVGLVLTLIGLVGLTVGATLAVLSRANQSLWIVATSAFLVACGSVIMTARKDVSLRKIFGGMSLVLVGILSLCGVAAMTMTWGGDSALSALPLLLFGLAVSTFGVFLASGRWRRCAPPADAESQVQQPSDTGDLRKRAQRRVFGVACMLLLAAVSVGANGAVSMILSADHISNSGTMQLVPFQLISTQPRSPGASSGHSGKVSWTGTSCWYSDSYACGRRVATSGNRACLYANLGSCAPRRAVRQALGNPVFGGFGPFSATACDLHGGAAVRHRPVRGCRESAG